MNNIENINGSFGNQQEESIYENIEGDNIEEDNIRCCICTDGNKIRYNRLHVCVDSLICDECMNLFINRVPLKCPICNIELEYTKKYIEKPIYKLIRQYYYVPIYVISSILIITIYFGSILKSFEIIEDNPNFNKYNFNRGNCDNYYSDSECLIIKLYYYRYLLLFCLLFIKFPLYYVINTTVVFVVRYIKHDLFIGNIYNLSYILLDIIIIFVCVGYNNLKTIVNILYYYLIFAYIASYITISIMSMCINIISKIVIIYKHSKYVYVYDNIGVVYKNLIN